MAKKAKKAAKAKYKKRVFWTRATIAELRRHSKLKTPVVKLEKLFKRTATNLRQKASKLGFSIGHQPRKAKR